MSFETIKIWDWEESPSSESQKTELSIFEGFDSEDSKVSEAIEEVFVGEEKERLGRSIDIEVIIGTRRRLREKRASFGVKTKRVLTNLVGLMLLVTSAISYGNTDNVKGVIQDPPYEYTGEEEEKGLGFAETEDLSIGEGFLEPSVISREEVYEEEEFATSEVQEQQIQTENAEDDIPVIAETEDLSIGEGSLEPSVISREEVYEEEEFATSEVQEQQIQTENAEDDIPVIEEIENIEEEILVTPEVRFLSAENINFRTEFVIENTGNETSRQIILSLPMLDSNSIYQEQVIKNTSHELIQIDGRMGTFDLGSLDPGETKTFFVDYDVMNRQISVQGENQEIDKVREIYERFPNTGDCLNLSNALMVELQKEGYQSRVVYGFARPEYANARSGNLSGSRHAWVEVYIENLGWIPMDLTFNYFMELPYSSHIVEGYDNPSSKLNSFGGDLKISWNNEIL